jgi:hypothetical protein
LLPWRYRYVVRTGQEHPALRVCVQLITPNTGCVVQTLRDGACGHEIDAGVLDGPSYDDCVRTKDLERAVKELRKANEILKLAGAFSPKLGSTAD